MSPWKINVPSFDNYLIILTFDNLNCFKQLRLHMKTVEGAVSKKLCGKHWRELSVNNYVVNTEGSCL